MNAAYAYGLGYTGKGITVGVVDSGIYADHPEFQGGRIHPLEITGTYAADGYRYYSDDSARGDVKPDPASVFKAGDRFDTPGSYSTKFNDPHGTHVSGSIAAARNRQGMQGVAFEADLYVANTGGGDAMLDGPNEDYNYFKAAYGVDASAGARVVNTSWGSDFDESNYESTAGLISTYSYFYGKKTWLDGVADSVKQSDNIQVFAAGNDGGVDGVVPIMSAALPYARPDLERNWIAVGAETRGSDPKTVGLADFSNRAGDAKYWTVFAPGDDIDSTVPPSPDGEGSSDPNAEAGYYNASGTSMSAPHATGALAVVMQRYAYLDNQEARDVLLTTAQHHDAVTGTPDATTGLARDDAPNAQWGWGAIDLKAAMNGPGQFLGAFTVDMAAGQSDTWYNTITQDALIQRKGEDAAEQAATRKLFADKGWDKTPPTASDTILDQTTYAVATARAQAAASRVYEGSLVKSGPGTLVLDGAGSTYTGGTRLDGGALELGAAGAAGLGAITFGAGPETLIIDAAAFGATTTLSNVLGGLGLDDTIDFKDFGFGTDATATFGTGTIDLAFGKTDYRLNLKDAPTATPHLASDGGTGTLLSFLAPQPASTGTSPAPDPTPVTTATPVTTPTPIPTPVATTVTTPVTVTTVATPRFTSTSSTVTLAPPTLTFDPGVTVSDSTHVTLTGTASDPSGIVGVELFAGTTDLGAATLDAAGAWSFITGDGPGSYAGLTAVATAGDGATATAASRYDLETGIAGEPYAVVQTSTDDLNRVTGETQFTRRGRVFLQSATEYAPDGSAARTTDAGRFFNRKPFFAYVDRSAPDGTATEEDVFYKDGHQTVQGLVPGATLRSIADDTFFTTGGGNSFVFTPGFGQDVITSFQLGGADHDTISLPDRAKAFLTGILAHATTDAEGDAVLHLDRHDTITIEGVSPEELRHHRRDFTFHA